MRSSRRRHAAALGLTAMSLGVLAACGGSSSPDSSGGSAAPGGGEKGGGTLVFGASADPVSLDGAYTSDGESARVQRQIFETLVTTKPGGTEVEPLLAKSFEASEDGKSWTFDLQSGVTFTDGTPLDAAAVCYNFDRWYNFTGVQQSASVSYYWQTVFSGYANNEDDSLGESLYASCEAKDDTTAVINLTSPSASFLAGLALPAFSIASPKALEEFGADDVSGDGDTPSFNGTFGTKNPVGTGPFKLESNDKGSQVVLVRNDDYWGEQAKLERVIFKPIADGPARRAALEAGDIQGYDLVDPADLDALKAGGYQLLERPAFNVGYVGFNTAKPPMDNPKIREAIAHALNRQALVDAQYPPGAEVAKEFMPPQLFGYADDVTTYDYDVEKAKSLIAESGVTNPTLEFWYPTDVSRPYMPNPQANFQAFQTDLEAAGFTVVPKSAPWSPDYVDTVNSGGAAMYLIGWTGDFGDPDNFIGTFFRTSQPAWGPLDQGIYDQLEKARVDGDKDSRTEEYKKANRLIMDFLPGVPYVHTSPSLAFDADVKGYVPSPVSLEEFRTVSIG